MADNNNNAQPILTGAESAIQQLQLTNDTQKNIEICLRTMINLMQNPNGSGLVRRAPTESQSNYADNSSKWKFEERHSEPKYRSTGSVLGDFEAGIKEQLMDSLAGGSFKKSMQNALDTFAKEFGMDIRDLPREVGKQLSKQAMDSFKNSTMGKSLEKTASKYGNKALDAIFKNVKGGDAIKGGIKNVAQSFLHGGQGVTSAAAGNTGSTISGIVSKVGQSGIGKTLATKGAATAAAGTATTTAGTALMGAVGKVGAVMGGPWGLLIIGAIMTAIKILGPALKGLADMAKAVGKSFNKEENLRKKRMEEATERLKKDVRYMVEQPFKILEEAAKEWEQTWDNNLRKIGQTQGYDKESVYALYEGYAERLRNENLGSVINATDIVNKLSSVLDSGLSGQAAEEFAYIATKLNAAIPTQDFFQYVDTYSSIAANAVAQGMSQTQALAQANKQLEEFASNLLYSSRELAGGFSTGLKNSSDLFQNAVRIAQTAKTDNATEISGTLTSVSAIIGAVAPDLASSLVNNIVDAAIGGNNNSQLVALRSLAGVNASNTEFLKAMSEAPQKVFSELFTNLANMQSMSPDNYMEVAEGLADVFGIDKAAFARVDFNYLAQAINAMNTNSGTLEQNLKLLESGQTTTSAEQLKAQEINSIILEEGLAYVIDSEAGRMIQQHMWDEQLAVELESSTYAVDIQGAALSFLEGIRKTVTTLLNFLNPLGFIAKGVSNIMETTAEAIGNDQDIKEILKLGAVGSNAKAFNNLTTRGKDLNLTNSLVEKMGGTKGIAGLNTLTKVLSNTGNVVSSMVTLMPSADTFNKINDLARGNTLSLGSGLLNRARELTDTHNNKVASQYNWGTVGKSLAKAIQSTSANENTIKAVTKQATESSTKFAQEASNKRFKEFLDSAKDASKDMSYEQWVDTAKNFGISNYEEALDTYGRKEDEIRSYFEQHEAAQGAAVEQARKDDEKLFRDQNRGFWDYETGNGGIFQTAMWLPFFGDGQKYDTRMDIVDTALSNIQGQLGDESNHTVISGIEEISRKLGDDKDFTVLSVLGQIHNDINTTFVTTRSVFQQCLKGWLAYYNSIDNVYSKGLDKSSAWSNLKNAEKDQQTQATLALANALGVFTTEQLKNLDPQLQANVLLGEIVVLLQAIMQQNNNQAGGLSLAQTISALGLGVTSK